MENEKDSSKNNDAASSKKVIKKNDIKKFKDLEGKFVLVKVGTDDRPATTKDIEEIESKLNKLLEDNNVDCLTFVTHHAIEIQLIDR